MDFDRDIAVQRNLANKSSQRMKKVEKAVEKEMPFIEALDTRLNNQSWHGIPNRVKITRRLTKNMRYKERRIKAWQDELLNLDTARSAAAAKQVEIEERKAKAATLPQLTLETDLRKAFADRLDQMGEQAKDEALKAQYASYSKMVKDEVLLYSGVPSSLAGEFMGVCTGLGLDPQACSSMMILFFE